MLLWLEWLPDMSGGATSFEDVGGFGLSEERPGALLPYPPPKKKVDILYPSLKAYMSHFRRSSTSRPDWLKIAFNVPFLSSSWRGTEKTISPFWRTT